MTSRRVAKVSQAIREQVSTSILFELKDPRVKNVTVTNAEVSADLRSAKVYVSVMGDEKTQALTMHGLDSARGFLQAKLAERLQTRYTPILHFVLDQGVKRSIEASRLLREVLPDSPAENPDHPPGDAPHGGPAAEAAPSDPLSASSKERSAPSEGDETG